MLLMICGYFEPTAHHSMGPNSRIECCRFLELNDFPPPVEQKVLSASEISG
jgi:hypothetical protein